MASSFWLAKSEPSKFPWEQLVRDKRTTWDGVRSFEARNNLRAMKKGDLVLFYHSNEGKEIVGIVKIVREHYPDPTAKAGDWSVVEVAPLKPVRRKVSLKEVKAEPELQEMALVRRPRLSVQPVTPAEFEKILEMSGTKL